MTAPRPTNHATRSTRPRAATVFAAAFLAGAAAAVVVNRALDVRLAQRQPRVESEPIFVALRSLPQGAPVTVWDVALRDWPKAMLPAAAMRPRDSFEGLVLRHPVREGQPVLSVQLVRAAAPDEAQMAGVTPPAPQTVGGSTDQPDLWSPGEPPSAPVHQPPPSAAPTGDAMTAMTAMTALTAVVPSPTAAAEATSQPAGVVSSGPQPVVDAPVVVSTHPATDIDPAVDARGIEPLRAPAQPPMRYLVVPERIALEADRSFVPAVRETMQDSDTGAASPEPPRKPVPPVQQARVTRPAEPAATGRPGQAPRPPRSAAGQTGPARQPEKASFFRSWLPGLSLGMGAVEQQQRQQPPQQQPRTAAGTARQR